MTPSEVLRKLIKLGKLARVPAWRSAVRHHRVAAALEHRQALAGLGLATVIDVGANRGQFSLLARSLFPEAAIHCFEPHPEARNTLTEVFASDTRLQIQSVALSDSAGEVVLHVTRDLDSSSLLRPLAGQSAHFPGTEESGELEVTAARLDDCLDGGVERPALLKLDVQGHELAVLRGAENVLASVDYVYAEVSFDSFYRGQASASEVVCHLMARAFELVGVGNTQRSNTTGRIVQADFLFARSASTEGDLVEG